MKKIILLLVLLCQGIGQAQIVSTLAGSGTPGSNNGTAAGASFDVPYGILSDGTNLYIGANGNQSIRKIVIATGVVTTIAGNPSCSGYQDGTGTGACFLGPHGISTDGTYLYLADTGNHCIRKIMIATGVVTTLAGMGGPQGSGFAAIPGNIDATGTSASFKNPFDIATDGVGNLYVADTGNNKIRKIVIATGAVTTLAGSGATGSTDGTGIGASFKEPRGITFHSGNLYVGDYGNHKIRKIVVATGVVTTLAGSGTAGSVDGTGTSATFNYPSGLVTDGGANLYIVDSVNHKIRRLVIATGVVTTLAGTGISGSTDGPYNWATFLYPEGITSDNSGNLYVADTQSCKIRKITTTPTVLLSGTLNAFITCAGVPSAEQSFQVEGRLLTNDIVVTVPTAMEISTTSGSGYSSSITLKRTGDIVNPTTIYIRKNSGTAIISGNLNCTSTGATTQTQAISYTLFNNPSANTSQTNVSCNGGSDGSATVTASGGSSTYTYAWLPRGGSGTTATGLTAGTYTCTVTDSNGCKTVKTITITEPTAVVATTTQTNVSCNGGSDGTATITATGGGTAPYTYSWSPSGGTGTWATGLSKGTYSCTITDNKGCQAIKSFTITEPTLLTATTSQTNVSCNSGSDGTATITATGGTLLGVSDYTYSWTPNVSTGNVASNLSAGTYSCTVTDSKNCTVIKSVTITEPISLIDVTVTQTAGVLTANQAGASYRWYASNKATTTLGTGQSYTPTLIGDYNVTITLNGCSNTSAKITVTNLNTNTPEERLLFSIFPNPNQGILHINTTYEGDVNIINALGQTIKTVKVIANVPNNINIEDLTDGVYFLKGKNNTKVVFEKLIINK